MVEAVLQGEPLDRVLERELPSLPDADRRLAHELAAGVFRARGGLDVELADLVSRPWEQVTPTLQTVLRLGAYQIRFLDRVPSHAAVSTSVELARKTAGSAAAGFVNAVLRRVAERAALAPDTAATAHHPEWLAERWIVRYGEPGAARLMEWNNRRPRLAIQPARTSMEQLVSRLTAASIGAVPAPFGAGLIVTATRPTDLPGFEAGDFFVQDPAQALVVRYAGLSGSETVYDACAAPGGKAMAVSHAARRLVAGDSDRRRLGRLRENLARAGRADCRWFVIAADGTRPPVRPVDAVLLDAPCLGTGTFARHPDARWRATAAALARVVTRQRVLLEGLAPAVRPGGLLVYATCSLEPEENEGQVARFLGQHPEFRREPPGAMPAELLTEVGDLMILPQRDGMDGAYAARLRRVA